MFTAGSTSEVADICFEEEDDARSANQNRSNHPNHLLPARISVTLSKQSRFLSAFGSILLAHQPPSNSRTHKREVKHLQSERAISPFGYQTNKAASANKLTRQGAIHHVKAAAVNCNTRLLSSIQSNGFIITQVTAEQQHIFKTYVTKSVSKPIGIKQEACVHSLTHTAIASFFSQSKPCILSKK